MKVQLASIATREPGADFERVARIYLKRLPTYIPTESNIFGSETAFFDAANRIRARTSPVVVLLDSRGQLLSSENFATWIGQQRDSGVQNLIFAVGPADGWSDAARAQSHMLLSLGPMTLPHELARVVLAEQIYRAFTILAGHPYHSGH
jgi:23S rRNA (pseudouridine1915-N3)-methyltransferase